MLSIKLAIPILSLSAIFSYANETWETVGFEQFRAGDFLNGGQNIYVSHDGILQRIHHGDLNGDGKLDLLFCNSQGHEEYVYPDFYLDPINQPQQRQRLRIGGVSSAIAVGDLNGDGCDDVCFGAGWDGQSFAPNNMIFYGRPDGIDNRSLKYLPITGGRPVIGDFNGDGFKDLLFVKGTDNKFTLSMLAGTENALDTNQVINSEITSDAPTRKDAAILSVLTVPDVGGSALVVRSCDGAISILRNLNGKLEAQAQRLIDRDSDFKENTYQWQDANQYVPPPRARLALLKFNNQQYLFVARENYMLLYPYADGKVDTDKAKRFNVAHAISAEIADDLLLVAAVDRSAGQEQSFIYMKDANGEYSDATRRAIPTRQACDMALLKFNGKTFLTILQGPPENSYDGEVLLYEDFAVDKPLAAPRQLYSGDARLLVRPKLAGRQTLLIPNTRSGNATGKLNSVVYWGDGQRFAADRKQEFPGNGAFDGLFADLDNDGKVDVVFANEVEMSPHLNDGSYIYYQKPDGTFAPQPDIKLPTARASGMICADFDRDGYLDLLFNSLDSNELIFFYGDAERKFKRQKRVAVPQGCPGLWLKAADVNHDNWLDIAIPVGKYNSSVILLGDRGQYSYEKRLNFEVGKKSAVLLLDLNRDGWMDVVWGGGYPAMSGPETSFVSIFYGSKNGFNFARQTELPCAAANCMEAADFNRDGLPDLFIGSYDNMRTREVSSFIYWQSPSDGFTRDNYTLLPTSAACGVIAGDFDNNGWQDLAIANHKKNTQQRAHSQVWYNYNGQFQGKELLPTSGPHGMIAAPLDSSMDRSNTEFFESTVYRMKNSHRKLTVELQGSIPPKCSVTVKIRTAATPEALSKQSWRTLEKDNTLEYEFTAGTYCQYRLGLIAVAGNGTPRIKSVTLTWK